MASGLHNMHRDVCPGSKGLCPEMEPLNGSVYLQYLLNVSFKDYSDEDVHFDSQGDPPGRYEILNYQPILTPDGNITYDYITIGHWMTGSLTLNGHDVHWPRSLRSGQKENVGIVRSVCSEPCKRGQAKKVKGVACCWICTPCLENEILVDNNTDCNPCDLGMWPNVNKTDCEDITVNFIDWNHTEAIVCITVGCLGICVTVWVFFIFARHHDTPIVKASTRELSYIILVGMCMAFSSNFFIVAKPSKVFCYLTRILPGLSFSLMYGALVTRTNRIARILEGSKRIMTKKPRFMSATAQVVITGIIISIECSVIAGMLAYQPADSTMDYPSSKTVRLVCDTSTSGIIVPLTFDLVLIILCTLYAIKTRNLPENFNEAKFIGFTMYSTCVIWLGFFPIYFAGDRKEITLSLSVSLSATIALLLLFVPKVYVIVWVPEKNTRGAFTTSKDVRCHIGSKSMASGDSIDIKDSSTSDKGQSKYWKQRSLDEKRFRFVAQKVGGSDGETPYTNHGVLANIPRQRNAFADRDSKDSSKTDTTPVSSLSCPEKDRLFYTETKDVTNAEIIRQNLAKDYPMHKRQITARPGSPAEKEKHRIHSVDRPAHLDMLLEVTTLHNQRKSGKCGDFRKSLSSTCVSNYSKTKTVQCQTGDELVFNLLPPLRKRRLSNLKNKLERSGAVDDSIAPQEIISNDVHVFRNPTQCRTQSLTIPRPQVTLHQPSQLHSPSEQKDRSPQVIFHGCDPHNFCSSSESETEESPSLLHICPEEHMQRRHSYNIHPLDHYQNSPDFHRRCSNDPGSFKLPSSDVRSLQTFKPRTQTPPDATDFSFMDGVEKFENSISSLCQNQRSRFSRYPPNDPPQPGYSSTHSVNNPSSYDHNNETSHSTPTHQESLYSTSISTTSSSFTLPPFPNSIDSNLSEETFGDSDNNFENEESNNNTGPNLCDNADLINTHQGNFSQQKGSNHLNSNYMQSAVPVVAPLDKLDKMEDDVLEFQKYLHGHGVKIDLSQVKSSDL
uniref:G-protein coupled receptors family 3 profile domain-containing protein n=3 Tax=Arion vulgaris TaxID=1028688 RepID=A0A0B7B0T2_9EUPU